LKVFLTLLISMGVGHFARLHFPLALSSPSNREISISANGTVSQTNLMDMVSFQQLKTALFTKDISAKAFGMAMEFSSLVEVSSQVIITWVSFKTVNEKGRESIFGLISRGLLEIGRILKRKVLES
jgi:hypothetical protein